MGENDAGAATDHRAIAAETYNRCWDVLESVRTPDQDRELLGLALASRYHWSVVGGDQQRAIADWMVSRCFAALGEGRLAVSFAQAALDRLRDDLPAWLRASLHEGAARAFAAASDAAGRDRHLQLARAELAAEPDVEERELVREQIDSVR